MSTPTSADEEETETASSPSSPLPAVALESPLNSMASDFRTALDEFRVNWQRELKGGHSGPSTPTHRGDQLKADAEEELQDILSPLPNMANQSEAEKQLLAESLFRKAVELEQRGKVYDALPFYRKAVQIVPDIEFKFYEHQKKISSSMETTSTGGGNQPFHNQSNTLEADDCSLVEDLYEKFQLDLEDECGGQLLLSNRDASVLSTESHISCLPAEILLYILRWVVSTQLDMRSLEQCAAVCKGMYLCARDEDIWRLACAKVWGINVGTLNHPTGESSNEMDTPDHSTLATYASWRHMFIERERVLFSGCYISKTTYIRMGENSFQDKYYRPVQLVEYYRYIRFLPDGTVLMMTTADEPAQGVPKLRHLQQLRPEILRGHYRLYGSTVTILLNKQQHQAQRIIPTAHQHARPRRGSSAASYAEELNCTKYCMEFRIMNTPKRKFSQLVWLHYSIVQTRNKVETASEFDLAPSKYPVLWFSPVRSYHLDADAPLA